MLKRETLSVTDPGREFTWGSVLLSSLYCRVIRLVKNLRVAFKKKLKYTMFFSWRLFPLCPRKIKQRVFEQFCLIFLKGVTEKY